MTKSASSVENSAKASSKTVSRRGFLGALGGVSAGVLAAPSIARAQQTTLMDILNNPNRGVWEDEFDAGQVNRHNVKTNIPILSDNTVAYVEGAINQYRGIVGQGGWPVVNTSESMKLGFSGAAVEQLRRRLIIAGDMPASAGMSTSYDSFVDQGVKKFQARHGLPADGVIGNQTLQVLNVSAPVRLGQLETNHVRLKSMAGFKGDRYVMVNIPAAEIEAVEGDSVVQRHTAIVGKIDRQTPILNSKIYEVILNPYWTAPKSIILKDIIPVMRKDPEYLTRNSIRLFDWNTKEEIAPGTLDWSTDEPANYMFRQDPGKINAMASTKINFHNPHAVYMHDTPQQHLFGQTVRFDSSGCVRVQNVRSLSQWLLRNTPGWDRQEIDSVVASRVSTNIGMTDQVPVYFTYVSGWAASDGVVHFRNDVYSRDGVSELMLSSTL